MAKRVQLNEEQMENVVGGAFNFYTNSKGLQKCYVDDIGYYFVRPNAFDWVVKKTAGTGLSASEVVQEALELGYFSETAFAD